MKRLALTLTVALALAGALGCGDEEPVVISLAEPPAPPQPPQPPIPPAAQAVAADYAPTPVSYLQTRPDGGPGQGLPGLPPAAGGSGGGGGGGRDERPSHREGRRAAEAFEDMSPADALALFNQARSLARAEDPDDGCARLLAGFGALSERSGRAPVVSDERFSRMCQSMPEELQACFRDPSERTPQQQARCTQMLGTEDIFSPNPRETQRIRVPPGTRMPTEAEREDARRIGSLSGMVSR